MDNRITRSRSDRMIAGVCAGLARYFGVDPTLVRLAFVVLAFATGAGVFIYFVLWIVLPPEGRPASDMEANVQANADEMAERARSIGADLRTAAREPNPRAAMFFGGALIVVGLVVLVENLHLPWLWWFRGDTLWPVLLIAIGLLMIWNRARKG